MSDRRLFINSRVDTAQLRGAAYNLTFYGIETIRRYQERVDSFNPGLNPLPERLGIRIALAKVGLPTEYRQEWKAADESLALLLKDINKMKHPAIVWKGLFQKFQYATELPTKRQAAAYLNQTRARIQNLASLNHDPNFSSITLASGVYIENLMLIGAFSSSTFFIRVEKPNLN